MKDFNIPPEDLHKAATQAKAQAESMLAWADSVLEPVDILAEDAKASGFGQRLIHTTDKPLSTSPRQLSDGGVEVGNTVFDFSSDIGLSFAFEPEEPSVVEEIPAHWQGSVTFPLSDEDSQKVKQLWWDLQKPGANVMASLALLNIGGVESEEV